MSYTISNYTKRTFTDTVETLQPKKYLKWFIELRSDDGRNYATYAN